MENKYINRLKSYDLIPSVEDRLMPFLTDPKLVESLKIYLNSNGDLESENKDIQNLISNNDIDYLIIVLEDFELYKSYINSNLCNENDMCYIPKKIREDSDFPLKCIKLIVEKIENGEKESNLLDTTLIEEIKDSSYLKELVRKDIKWSMNQYYYLIVGTNDSIFIIDCINKATEFGFDFDLCIDLVLKANDPQFINQWIEEKKRTGTEFKERDEIRLHTAVLKANNNRPLPGKIMDNSGVGEIQLSEGITVTIEIKCSGEKCWNTRNIIEGNTDLECWTVRDINTPIIYFNNMHPFTLVSPKITNGNLTISKEIETICLILDYMGYVYGEYEVNVACSKKLPNKGTIDIKYDSVMDNLKPDEWIKRINMMLKYLELSEKLDITLFPLKATHTEKAVLPDTNPGGEEH